MLGRMSDLKDGSLRPGDPVRITWDAHVGTDDGEFVGPCSETSRYVRVRVMMMGKWTVYIVKASQVKGIRSA